MQNIASKHSLKYGVQIEKKGRLGHYKRKSCHLWPCLGPIHAHTGHNRRNNINKTFISNSYKAKKIRIMQI